MNHSVACGCSSGGGDSVPLAIVSLCVSFSSLVASFFTHSKLLELFYSSSMRGQSRYGKMATMES